MKAWWRGLQERERRLVLLAEEVRRAGGCSAVWRRSWGVDSEPKPWPAVARPWR